MFTAEIIAPDLRIWPSVQRRARKQVVGRVMRRLLTRAVLAPIPNRPNRLMKTHKPCDKVRFGGAGTVRARKQAADL
jgi:hypothetical protein